MKLWTILAAMGIMGILSVQPVYGAEQSVIMNDWQNEELGPGGARWVDENGVVWDQPGIKPDQEGATESAEAGPGGEIVPKSGEAANSQTEAAPAEENQQPEEQEKPAETAQGRVIDPSRPMVALTFDDGPYAPVGNRLMDTLGKYDAKATFYVVGNRCPSYQAELQRMVAEGHEIGNHTYEHKYLNQLNAAQIRQQIDRAADTIQSICGVRPVSVRLPGGNKNRTVLAAVQEPIVLWNVDTLDWKTRNAQKTVEKVLSQVKDGDIILMHELYGATADAVDRIVPELQARGFQMVTVSEMAQYRRGGLQNGQVYYQMQP